MNQCYDNANIVEDSEQKNKTTHSQKVMDFENIKCKECGNKLTNIKNVNKHSGEKFKKSTTECAKCAMKFTCRGQRNEHDNEECEMYEISKNKMIESLQINRGMSLFDKRIECGNCKNVLNDEEEFDHHILLCIYVKNVKPIFPRHKI